MTWMKHSFGLPYLQGCTPLQSSCMKHWEIHTDMQDMEAHFHAVCKNYEARPWTILEQLGSLKYLMAGRKKRARCWQVCWWKALRQEAVPWEAVAQAETQAGARAEGWAWPRALPAAKGCPSGLAGR